MKIIYVFFIFVLVGFSLNKKQVPAKCKNDPQVVVINDTVSFSSHESLVKYSDSFLIEGAARIQEGLTYKTSGNGLNIWIDSLLYSFKHQNRFIAVAATLDYGYYILYYNGDSLSIEEIAANNPIVEECQTNKLKVISIIDSVFNSGYILKSIFFYQIDFNGILSNERKYFPMRRASEKFDFIINTKCFKDYFLIYKNDSLIYKY